MSYHPQKACDRGCGVIAQACQWGWWDVKHLTGPLFPGAEILTIRDWKSVQWKRGCLFWMVGMSLEWTFQCNSKPCFDASTYVAPANSVAAVWRNVQADPVGGGLGNCKSLLGL